jgi:anti-sigma factor RsiW
MSHLGQRLSALIDGELDGTERDRVLVHLARCEPCRGEAVALRTLKRRMSALGEATAADSTLTFRLMGLAQPEDPFARRRSSMPVTPWSSLTGAVQASGRGHEVRPSWYLVGGSFGVLLAGLAAAAFMAGGSQQVPAPRVTPAVEMFFAQHDNDTGVAPATPSRPGKPAFGKAAQHVP